MAGQIELEKRNFLKIAAVAGATLAGGLVVPPALGQPPGKRIRKGTGGNSSRGSDARAWRARPAAPGL